jgi:hypothetical protein
MAGVLSFFLSVLAYNSIHIHWNGEYDDDYEDYEANYQRMEKWNEGVLGQQVLVIVFLFCISFQLFIKTLYTPILGNFLPFLVKMTNKSLVFVVVFAVIILIFGIIGYALFFDITEFSTFGLSMITLYESALGGFDFSIFDGTINSSAVLGKFYMVIYLMVSFMVLLNFLIAIMTDAYVSLQGKIVGVKNHEILKIRALYDHDDRYDCLIRGQQNFSTIPLLFLPFIVYTGSTKLNTIIKRVVFT